MYLQLKLYLLFFGEIVSHQSLSQTHTQVRLVCADCFYYIATTDRGGQQLTDNLKVALPHPHGVGVDLTHVPAAITLLHVLEVKVPGAVVVVRQRDAGVLRDHVVVDGQDGLGVHAHPRYLPRDTQILAHVTPLLHSTHLTPVVLYLCKLLR